MHFAPRGRWYHPAPGLCASACGRPPSIREAASPEPGRPLQRGGCWALGARARRARAGPLGHTGRRRVSAAQRLHAASFAPCGELPPLFTQTILRALGCVPRAPPPSPSQSPVLQRDDARGWAGREIARRSGREMGRDAPYPWEGVMRRRICKEESINS